MDLHILLCPKGREIASPWKVCWNLIFIIFLKFVLALSRSTLRGFGSGSLTLGHIETYIETQEEVGNSSAELKEASPEEGLFSICSPGGQEGRIQDCGQGQGKGKEAAEISGPPL